MATVNCLVTNIFLNILFCVNDDRNLFFWVNYPFKLINKKITNCILFKNGL